MHSYVALLRAVNVGGTGKLPMSELKALCERAGFAQVRTYIASGNVVFHSTEPPARVKAVLEQALHEYAGKPVGVMLRTAAEMAAVLAANPFPEAAPDRTLVIFLDHAPALDAVSNVSGLKTEQLAPGVRELYVHYGDGIGTSKLKIPAAKDGTARNMNSVAKLVEMASA